MARRALIAALLCAAAWPGAARAADPGGWAYTGHSRLPIVYYQGVTSDPARRLWFDGVFEGLYRTDDALREQARNDAEIPPTVTAAEGYNHIGDITFDGQEGGRVLLPLECYYPLNPGEANTCHTGSFGVADPTTLAWRYYVKLDPVEIPKAMWVEASPDAQLLWTSSGNDLLAYSAADVRPDRAAPGGAPLRAVRRLAGAVPPTGITGASFYGGRLFVSGQDGDVFQIWSIDLATGSRRLEIERRIVGESEGLDVIDAFGGVLHWIVTPFTLSGKRPTYGSNGTALLHFRPIGRRNALRVSATPSTLIVRHRTRVTFTLTAREDGRRRPVAGATIRIAGKRTTTSAAGIARVTLRFTRPGTRRATATLAGLRASVLLRIIRRPPTACTGATARAAC